MIPVTTCKASKIWVASFLMATVFFVAHSALVVNSVDQQGEYNLTGMWIIPEGYAESINSPDASVRIYNRLLGWDGHWYYHIAKNGYQCSGSIDRNNPAECNVAFYPLLPMLGNLLESAGFDLTYVLPTISHIVYFIVLWVLIGFVWMHWGVRFDTIAPYKADKNPQHDKVDNMRNRW
ncbi:MAG: hypothetical protein AAF353_04050 [Pseudomonadota bacterium]